MQRFIALIVVFLISHNALLAQKNQGSYLVVPNIKYASYPKSDPKLNMLDVYMPKKGSNSPILIWVHGGSFAYGDKEYVQEKAAGLHGHGTKGRRTFIATLSTQARSVTKQTNRPRA